MGCQMLAMAADAEFMTVGIKQALQAQQAQLGLNIHQPLPRAEIHKIEGDPQLEAVPTMYRSQSSLGSLVASCWRSLPWILIIMEGSKGREMREALPPGRARRWTRIRSAIQDQWS